jgi:hypothetical protein
MSKNDPNFHKLALHGKLDTIDPKLLTMENLLDTKEHTNSPIKLANFNGKLHKIPYPILIKIAKKECGTIAEADYQIALKKSKEIYRKKLTKEIPQALKNKSYVQK